MLWNWECKRNFTFNRFLQHTKIQQTFYTLGGRDLANRSSAVLQIKKKMKWQNSLNDHNLLPNANICPSQFNGLLERYVCTCKSCLLQILNDIRIKYEIGPKFNKFFIELFVYRYVWSTTPIDTLKYFSHTVPSNVLSIAWH